MYLQLGGGTWGDIGCNGLLLLLTIYNLHWPGLELSNRLYPYVSRVSSMTITPSQIPIGIY